MTLDVLWVLFASAGGGFVDAIVGGGGLILVPALFAVYPATPPATLFGTNKAAAIWGTGWATWQYARRVRMDWACLLPSALAAALGSVAGASLVAFIPAEGLRKALPIVLAALLGYTLMRKDLGRRHEPLGDPGMALRRGVAIGAVIGLYDGLFGPGTGSFFVFLFVRLLRYDFLHASAAAKLLNVSTNASAVTWFAWTGHVWWHLALPMAVVNVLGSVVGARLATRHGAGFVRAVFLCVVSALIVRTAWDGWWR